MITFKTQNTVQQHGFVGSATRFSNNTSMGKPAQFAPGNDCGNPHFKIFNWYNQLLLVLG